MPTRARSRRIDILLDRFSSRIPARAISSRIDHLLDELSSQIFTRARSKWIDHLLDQFSSQIHAQARSTRIHHLFDQFSSQIPTWARCRRIVTQFNMTHFVGCLLFAYYLPLTWSVFFTNFYQSEMQTNRYAIWQILLVACYLLTISLLFA